MSEAIHILIVEDDKNTGFLLVENLRLSKYKVSLAEDGESGLEQFKNKGFQLCILDIMLPKRDGLSLATEIRKIDKDIPIIFLTARTLSNDLIEGFKAGCDDYITKPFNIDELLWRIKAILRRGQENTTPTASYTTVLINDFTFSYAERLLKIKDKEFKLSTKEAEIILCLTLNIGLPVSRTKIMEKVWGNDDYFISKSLDVFLTKIRKYFSVSENVKLVNIHGHGYKLIISNTETA